MIVLKSHAWRMIRLLLVVAGVSITVCAIALWQLNRTSDQRDRASDQRDRAFAQLHAQVMENQNLINRLQQQARDGASADADQRRREAAFLLLVQELQAQVRSLGGTPLPVPAALRSTGPSRVSSDSSSPSPRPTAAASPVPTATPGPRPRPSSSPSPTPTSTAPVCVKIPVVTIGC